MPTTVCCVPIILLLALIVRQVTNRGGISRPRANIVLAGLALLLVLLMWYSVPAVRLVNCFKGLQPRDVRSIAFFDEARNHYRLDRSDPAALATCLEREMTDPAAINALVASFGQSHAYFRNHEGARDRYLVRITTTSGENIWFILGRGTRSDPRTAWVEFNSNVTDGWHYGIFSNTELFKVLGERVPLRKWPQSPHKTGNPDNTGIEGTTDSLPSRSVASDRLLPASGPHRQGTVQKLQGSASSMTSYLAQGFPMADGDEVPTIADTEDAAWAAEQRKVVETYLRTQGCEHAGVSLEPRWYMSPYLAVWAVRSKANPNLIGWWAISGDVPTDYLTASRELRCTADVLVAFGTQWTRAAEAMSRGEHAGIGKPENTAKLAPLLRTRASMLQELSEQVRAEEGER